MSLLDNAQKAEEVRFIKQKEGWPMWPILPLKRRPEVEDEDNEGIVLAGAPTTIHFMNMWSLKTGLVGPQLEGVANKTYESIEAMVDAGWMVD